MRTRSGTEKKLEVSISDAAGKNLPEAQLHLHFHAIALSYGEAWSMPRNSLNQQVQPKN